MQFKKIPKDLNGSQLGKKSGHFKVRIIYDCKIFIFLQRQHSDGGFLRKDK